MDLIETARALLKRIDALLENPEAKRASALPDGGYFLDENTVLCLERANGDARFPYTADGFNLWAHSSGYISINESTFYVVLSADGGKEPYLNFYAGLPADGGYVPVSLTGAARSPLEGETARYTVFTPQAVYYLTRTAAADFVVRAYVTREKTVRFSLAALGKTDTELYLAGYFNCFLMHAAAECCETPWFRQCRAIPSGFEFYSVEDLDRSTHLDNYGVLTRTVNAQETGRSTTTSRTDFTGAKSNYLAASRSLRTGRFAEGRQATKFTDAAIAGDIVRVALTDGGAARVDYSLDAVFDTASCAAKAAALPSPQEFDKYVEEAERMDREKKNSPLMLEMRFENSELPALSAATLEKFVGFVVRQVEFAALSKNSGVSLLGVRDVFQQLEAALMWTGEKCRAKIIEALGFVCEDGRPPRQYSIPPTPDAPPQMDLRKFIDQGVWIIDTVYRYLAYTGDYSILDEPCGYYRFEKGIQKTDEITTVLEHLVRISRFLISNIDEKTNCLHALYGDWNDALDGMGVSSDGSKEFGTGVSVMATLQLYHNMTEMGEILAETDKKEALPTAEVKKRLERGLTEYALVRESAGRRILHGWGDERSYLVGSSRDPDGKDRVGLTSYAFWVISGMYARDKSVREDILRAYQRLDSKYGLRTFDQFFAPGTPGVGRIGNLPPGTAENSATYVHATLFGVWSLFMMGEDKAAWEQLIKALPVTHAHLSATQFVMSNSYSLNPEFSMDGESMSDWYTGAANVLIKTLVRCVFGVDATLEGVYIRPAAYMPFASAKIRIAVRGCSVRVEYVKKGNGKRVFRVGGKFREAPPDPVSGAPALLLSEADLKGETLVISVED